MTEQPSDQSKKRPEASVTLLLNRAAKGDQSAAREMIPLIYDELRRIAEAKRRAASSGETLRSTALVHEAYLRVIDREPDGWKQRSHFFYAAARAMRDILVEESRHRSAEKRGGLADRVSLDRVGVSIQAPSDQVLALERCLNQLEDTDELGHKIVMFRFFVGLSTPEISQIIDTPIRTIERKWSFLRVWLASELATR